MKYTNVKIKKEKKLRKIPTLALVLLIGGLIATAWFVIKNKGRGNFSRISIVTSVSAADVKETDGRTNILILGEDKRSTGPVTSVLTDTILVASIGKIDKDVVLISVPRDLWVESSNGYHMKINALYAYNGIEETEKAVSQVLGIPIHYRILVNFQLFEDAINLLDGINVNVEHAFTDYYYPVEGKENDLCGKTQDEVDKMLSEGQDQLQVVPCRFLTVSFKEGQQTMDGVKALQFARSRHGDNNEGTDFARAKRQQKIIMGVKDKALSLQTLINPQKLKDLYNLYSKNVETDVDLGTLQNFYLLSQQIKFNKITSVVLDDRSNATSGGLLYSPVDTSLYGGAYVLVPQTGDYTQIHAYVQKYLFGDK